MLTSTPNRWMQCPDCGRDAALNVMTGECSVISCVRHVPAGCQCTHEAYFHGEVCGSVNLVASGLCFDCGALCE